MVKKRVDPRVKGLIEHGVRTNHRSLFVLVGDHGKDQVENLHKILSRARVKARPSVLWCYKKELGFSTHKQKRMREIKRNQARGLHDPDRDDPFDLFISSTNIRWTYYKESDKILGQTFGMCVLQDFEALTPNLLARTIETVEGGGLVIMLMKTVKSLKQLYTLSMDVHSRFRTEAHHEIVPRFNERFILSLGVCAGCLVLDDELNILPISSNAELVPAASEGASVAASGDFEADSSGQAEDPALRELKLSLADTPNVGSLVALAKTVDQAQAVMTFLDAISEKTLKSTVALTAARGRGKSAAIGLCLAGAVSYGFANIFVTAPSAENLKTVFEFIISGLKALRYTEHLDFEIVQEHQGDIGKVVVRINIFRDHRQTIQYILPSDSAKLVQAELLAIDEAAAIPLPTVKKLMGPYLVFMSSTINGYEGTGRSLSLKLIQQLRTQQGQAMVQAAQQAGASVQGSKTKKGERHLHEERWKVAAEAAASHSTSSSARRLTEITLETPIRYSAADPIEKWLNNLLCLDVATHSTRMVSVMPAPRDCELYMVNRDALFSYHSLSEALLQRIWALYTSAHYKNTPNDLQMLSDAPAHRLFVLLGPRRSAPGSSSSSPASQLPDVLCVVQVAFEGFISQKSVQAEIQRGNKASGDLIPWTISQQFNDFEFASLSGARVVRIATHPDVQKMGYGSRAIDLLSAYFQGNLSASAGPSPPLGSFGGEGSEALEDVPGADAADDDSDAGADIDPETGELQRERVAPRAKLPALLTPISERPAERLHWLGVSFGMTSQLLNFWSRKGYKTCYLRQTSNELTGEHSSILLKELDCEGMALAPAPRWLDSFVSDYQKRLVSLLSYSFSKLDTVLAITLIDPERKLTSSSSSSALGDVDDDAPVDSADMSAVAVSSGSSGGATLTAEEILNVHLSYHDLKRLELYSRNMVDHHMILDTIPALTRLLFLGRLSNIRLSYLQVAVLLAIGLQHRDVDSIAAELDIPAAQVLAFFNKTVRKIVTRVRQIVEAHVSKELPQASSVRRLVSKASAMNSLGDTLAADQKKDEQEFSKKQRDLLLSNKTIARHAIHANSADLEKAVGSTLLRGDAVPSAVSVAVVKDVVEEHDEEGSSKREKKQKRKDKHGGKSDVAGASSGGDEVYSGKVSKKSKKN